MFSDILYLILFPIKELLKLLDSSAIESYLGFSVIEGIVTCAIIIIVIKALVNTTYVGLGSSLIHSRRRADIRSLRNSRSSEGNNNG